ncbi:S1 family peptidase [Clostridium botulinum]|uniref:S1 family peptidase n=1 Tax=Clostridium botulinum TaxID=1491 RepID=UPI001E3A27D3|nr:S1 family peptidase [Clostridium botulinum]
MNILSCEYCIDNIIKLICNNEYNFFLNKANVIGIGLGYKIKGGFCTCKKCIKVFVSTKIHKAQLQTKDLIPIMYKGIITDVNEVGYFKFQLLNTKVRPTIGGYSIGPNVPEYCSNIGSIGCLVKDSHSSYLLSSCHVLSALNKLTPGTGVVQPSLYDSGTPADEVGKLARYISLKPEGTFSKPTNLVDAAIVRFDAHVEGLPNIAFIGSPKGIDNAALNDGVFKAGRTSDETSGHVTAINVTCEISFSKGTNVTKYLFKNQIMTTKMSSEGDSGAVLVKANKKIVGLLVGCTNSNTVYNSINDVLQALDINVVL